MKLTNAEKYALERIPLELRFVKLTNAEKYALDLCDHTPTPAKGIPVATANSLVDRLMLRVSFRKGIGSVYVITDVGRAALKDSAP